SGLGGLCLVSKWVNTGNERSWALYLDDTGASSDLVFAWSVDGTAVKRVFVLDYVPTINTQTHFQVVRSGSSMFLFVDGVLQTLDGASDSIGTDILHTNRIAIAVGVMTDTSSRNFDGHIDELRILGRAANTATFTPESVAYTRPVSPWY
ncbi:MAG: hypothetical protein KAI41_01285, partial [Hyphomicrobiaceae bacterium]|nr:hypothetical protein [Hyphomicrobiaceae bacterium]